MSTAKQNDYRIEGDTAVILCPRKARGKHALELVYEVKIDRSDLERVLAFGFWRVGEYGCQLLYARHQVKKAGEPNQTTMLHRFLAGASDSLPVDHLNHKGLDNRKSNLRTVTRSINSMNLREHRGSVSPNGLGFRGKVGYWGKAYTTTTYPTREAAQVALAALIAGLRGTAGDRTRNLEVETPGDVHFTTVPPQESTGAQQ